MKLNPTARKGCGARAAPGAGCQALFVAICCIFFYFLFANKKGSGIVLT